MRVRTRAHRERRVSAAAPAALLLVLTGCAASPSPDTDPADTAPRPSSTVVIGDDLVFEVEIVRDDDERTRGLSGRDSLPVGTGMLFPFDRPTSTSVWMPDMAFSIDIAWIADGRIVGIETLPPCEKAAAARCPVWPSPGRIDALLEVPAGALHGVTLGDLFRVDAEIPGSPVNPGRLPDQRASTATISTVASAGPPQCALPPTRTHSGATSESDSTDPSAASERTVNSLGKPMSTWKAHAPPS